MSETYENLVYEERRALQSWKSAVAPLMRRIDQTTENLVWDLIVLSADNIHNPSPELDADVYKTAYELGSRALENRDLKSVKDIFRGALVEAIFRHMYVDVESSLGMLHFSQILSDAYSQAYIDRLKRTIRNQRTESLSNELRLAKHIQQHLLPKRIPRVPGFQFAGRLIPAAEVGGDYWSVKHYPEDNTVTLKLADITGHGIAAATLVAAVKFISGGQYKASKSAAEVMEKTNHVLVKETPTEILVSMVYGWLHPDSGEVDLVNAGHEAALICRHGLCTNIAPTGPVMGVTETTYGEVRFVLEPGDIICLASDGIIEARAERGDFFGMERLKAVVARLSDRTADEIADGVIFAVMSYAGHPHDDMSIVIIKAVERD